MAIAIFFVAHSTLSVFFQSFFLHRYAAHRMFTMSRRWERVMYLATFFAQGSSFLSPRGYAILHRMHHAFSDTEKDPHSPHHYPSPWKMMVRTWGVYDGLVKGRAVADKKFDGGYPTWPALDRLAASWVTRVAWGTGYTLFYLAFATAWWQFLLLPMHYLMGPVHGLIVNWCGHKYGYRNFESDDRSRNTLVFDFITLGELFQNNHHRFGMSPNFAVRWFEVDPTYQVMRVLAAAGIIRFSSNVQYGRFPLKAREAIPASEAPSHEAA
jgi:stearoyl-CoA desaturase (Delta-9 desaturase)